MKYLRILSILIPLTGLGILNTFSQIPDLGDENWLQNLYFSEDFNVTNLNLTNWKYWRDGETLDPSGGDNIMHIDTNHLTFDEENGISYLRINIEYRGSQGSILPPEHDKHIYKSSRISTMHAPIPLNRLKYGYFEIRCRFHDNTQMIKPAFWLQAGPDATTYREIDVFEYEQAYPDYIPLNLFWLDPKFKNYAQWAHKREDQFDYRDLWGGISYPYNNTVNYYPKADESLSGEDKWNIWGVEWNSKFITFYLNGKPIRNVTIDPLLSMEDFNEFMYLHISCGNTDYEWSGTTIGELFYYDIDYVNVYRLNYDCDFIISENDGNGYNFNSYPNKVIKSAIFKNTTLSANTTVRVTDFGELKSNFYVPAGKDFAIIPTPCDD